MLNRSCMNEVLMRFAELWFKSKSHDKEYAERAMVRNMEVRMATLQSMQDMIKIAIEFLERRRKDPVGSNGASGGHPFPWPDIESLSMEDRKILGDLFLKIGLHTTADAIFDKIREES